MNVAGPSKHALLELNRRVDDLARQNPTLAPAKARELAQEFGVSVDDVSARFQAQLRSHEGAVGGVEDAGRRSQQLREHNQGGAFAGQAQPSTTTPALKGANLKAPGDEAKAIAKQWAPMLEAVDYINDRIRQGRLSSPAADVEIQKLADGAPDPTRLWTKDGAATRAALHAAFDELAKLLPHAVVAKGEGFVRTADESALSNHINEALFVNDKGAARALASEYVKRFPDAALAAWARGIADG